MVSIQQNGQPQNGEYPPTNVVTDSEGQVVHGDDLEVVNGNPQNPMASHSRGSNGNPNGNNFVKLPAVFAPTERAPIFDEKNVLLNNPVLIKKETNQNDEAITIDVLPVDWKANMIRKQNGVQEERLPPPKVVDDITVRIPELANSPLINNNNTNDAGILDAPIARPENSNNSNSQQNNSNQSVVPTRLIHKKKANKSKLLKKKN